MLLTLITFFIVLSVLVLVHEFGHFLVAKKAGIKIEEFGLGYPPRILGKKIGKTIYSLNWIPFGGFVRLYGEELSHFAKATRDKAFWAKSKKVRTAVIIAGVLANFLLAIFCFSIVYSFTGIPKKTNEVRIVGVIQNSPAEKFGLKEEDVILEVDGQKIDNLEKFLNLIQKNKSVRVKLLVERKEEGNLLLWVTPRENPPEGEGPLGVVVSDTKIIKYPFWQMPLRGGIEGIKEALGWGALILTSLKKMLLDLFFRGVIPKDVAGPIGIFQVTANVAKGGILTVLQFIGVLSVNLAILNILPFPVLDGGRLVFIAYELVARRRPKPSLERFINAIGMAFLLFLIILVTINDLSRIPKVVEITSRLFSFWPF